METDCNSESDRSRDVSMEDEDESNSLKNLNQNEEVKSDAMDTIQTEDSGMTWETSSSRCSTSQASETSATSGVYSMENSYMEGLPGKAVFLMDEGDMVQKRISNSPDQASLSSNEKRGPDNKTCDFSEKALERELDAADPQSWSLQVQPSKIKNYLVQITQEAATSLTEEKENALIKKGELPLEGTVRTRIQLITAVLAERNKKIFRRVNNQDLPPPSDIVRKPRQQPKIFTRQAMLKASLRHLEREAAIKNNKKETLCYNLRHVQTNIPKSGVSIPCNTDEMQLRQSFLPEPLNKASKKVPPISSLLTDTAKKRGTRLHSPVTPTTVPEQTSFTYHDKMENKGKQSHLLDTANTMSEKLPNLLTETEKEEMQGYSPMITEVTDISEESRAPPERKTVRPSSPVSTEPLSQPANETESQSDSSITMLSEPAAHNVQYSNNIAAKHYESQDSVSTETRNQDTEFTIPSQLEIKDSGLLHSAEEAWKQDIPTCSPETSESVVKQAKLLPSVSEREKQEQKQLEAEYSKKEEAQEQLTTLLQAKSEHLMQSVKEWEAGETETVPDLSSTTGTREPQEFQSDLYEIADEHTGLPQPSYFMDEAEKKEKEHLESDLAKQTVQAQAPVTTSLEPEESDILYSGSEAENEMAQPESQCPDPSPPVPEAQREEINQHATVLAQPESDYLVVSEPTKAPQRLESMGPLHLKGKEVTLHSPAESLNSSEQLPPILSAENVEKQETQQPSLVTETPLPECLESVLPHPTEQLEKQDNLPCSPEIAETAEASLLTVAFQKAEVTKAEVHPSSPTVVPSEELVPISREPDVAIGRKTTQLVSPLSVEPPGKVSIPPQEAVEVENHFSPPIHAKLSSEDQDESHPTIDESHQEGQFPLFATTQFELGLSTESESTMQNINQNFSVSSRLEETTALHSVDEVEKNLAYSPEIATETAELSLPTVAFQKAEVTKAEVHPSSPTVVPSEGLVSISREPDVATDRKQLASPLSVESPGKVSIPPQEAVKIENQFSPPIHAKLSSEEQDESHPTIDESHQEGQFPLFATTWCELGLSTKSESTMQNINQNSSVSSRLEETTVLHSVDEVEKNLAYSPEIATETADISLLTVAFQKAEVTKAEVHPSSPTVVPSEELVPISREPDVAIGRKTTQLVSPLSVEPPGKVSIPPQEAVEVENHFSPPIHAKLSSEDQDESHPTIDESHQEGQFPLFATTQFELGLSTESESTMQNINQNFSVSSRLVETTALHSVDEVEKNLAYSPEIATETAELSLPTVAFQKAEVTKAEVHPSSPTVIPSEELVSISREPDVATDRKQLASPVSVESPSKVSIPPQEAVKIENQFSPPIHAKLSSEEQDESHPTIDESHQEDQFPLFATTWFELGLLAESESTMQNINQNSSVSSRLEETTALHSVDDVEKNLPYSPEIAAETAELSLPTVAFQKAEVTKGVHPSSPTVVPSEELVSISREPDVATDRKQLASPLSVESPGKVSIPPQEAVKIENQFSPPIHAKLSSENQDESHPTIDESHQEDQFPLFATTWCELGLSTKSESTMQNINQNSSVSSRLEETTVLHSVDEVEKNLAYSPEIATETADISLLTVAFQKAEVTKAEVHPSSPTEVPSEELVPISREPDVAIGRKTTQLVSPLSVEPPGKVSIPPQEAVEVENHFSPPIHAKLSSEDQDESHPTIDEGHQEGQFPLFATTWFELGLSTESESTMQNINQNSSVSSRLEETTALHSVDEVEKNLAYSPEIATETADLSLPTVAFQKAEVTKAEVHPSSPTVIPSDELVSISREPDVATDRKQLASPVSVESPSKVSIPPQEAVKIENQFSPPIHAKLSSEEQDESHPTIDEGHQEDQFPLFATTWFELGHSAESESTMQNIKQNSSVSSRLEETTVLHSVDEVEKNLAYSPEIATETADLSLPTVAFQKAEVTKAEVHPSSPTVVPSEELVPISREPDVAIGRKTTQLVSPLYVEPPGKVSIPPQEAVEVENHFSPPIHAKLSSEDQDESHPTIDEGHQEGQFPLFATTRFELGHSAESESTMQNIKQNSAVSSWLEVTTALHCVDEAKKKDMHPDKSIIKPSHLDSLHSVCMPEKQERTESEIEQTTQQLSHTVLPKESCKLQPVEEIEVNGIQPHLSATAQTSSQSVYMMETQADQSVSKRTAALDSGSTSTPYTEAEVEKYNTTEPISKDMANQAIQAVTATVEPCYPKELHSVSESGKHLDAPFPVQNTEEGDLESQRFAAPESEGKHSVSSERKREESEFYSIITPASELGHLTGGPETQESQSCSSDTLKVASKPSPNISSFILDEIKDQPVPPVLIVSPAPASEQSNFLSPILKDKAKIEENQTPFPETPKMALQKPLSFAAFLFDETKGDSLDSLVATIPPPEESNSIPENFFSEEVKEMAPPSSPLSTEQLSKEAISLSDAEEEKKQDQSCSLLREESKHLAAGEANVQGDQSYLLVMAQPEARSQEIKPYCPETTQPELDLTLLNSTEEIRKEEPPLYSPSLVSSASIHQEILYHEGERENQGRVTFETEPSKEQDALLKSPILAQELEHLHLLQSVKDSQIEGIQPYSSATVQGSSQLLGETGIQEHQGYLPKTVEVDSGVSKLSELMDVVKNQTQLLWSEATELESKQSILSEEQREKIQYPLITTPLDLGHLGSSYSTEIPFCSSEAQNQTSEQPPSVPSLLTEKVEEQEVHSQPPAVSTSSMLGQPNTAPWDLIEEDEKQQTKPCPPEVANVISDEPLSIAAFLLSEAKEIHSTFPLTSKKDHLDTQPPFKEADFLIERSENTSTGPPETNVTVKRETEPPTTHFEMEQFASEPEEDVTYDGREDISDILTLSNFIPNKPSSVVILELVNDTLTNNLHSSVSSADSDTTASKTLSSIEDFSKTEENKCLPTIEKTLKEPENYIQKEKELKDHEKLRDEAIHDLELDQGKDIFSISEGYEVVNMHTAPLSSSADKEEKHTLETLEYLETVSLQETKPFNDVRDMVGNHELSVCKLSAKTSESLKGDNHENTEYKSKELFKEKGDKESVETKKEMSIIQENKDVGALNYTGMDYFEKYTFVDNTFFTQTGKEQFLKEVQGPFEVTKENSATPPVRENDKNTEDELNLAGKPLFNTGEDVLSQSPFIPLPATTVSPEPLDMPPALAFLYKDLYKESVEGSKEDSHKCPSNEESENTDMSPHTRGPTPYYGTKMSIQRDVSKDQTPNLEESQKEQVLKDHPINEQGLNLFSNGADEPNEKEPQSVHFLAEAHAQPEDLPPRGIVEGLNDALTDRPAEIISDIKVETCYPTHAITFGSGLYSSDANNDGNNQRTAEESLDFEGHVSKVHTPNLEESQKEQILGDQPNNEQGLDLFSKGADEPNEKELQSVHFLAEAHALPEILPPRGVVEGLNDVLTDRPAEIISDIKVGTCYPTHAIPFGSGLYSSGASNDDNNQRAEKSLDFERDVSKDHTPNLEESQKEQILEGQPNNEQGLNLFSNSADEPNEKELQSVHFLAEAHALPEILPPRGIVEGLNDALTDRPAEIISDIKVGTCHPTHAIPFGSGLYSSGASNDDSSQRRAEESLPEEAGQVLPEETSDEEYSPIPDYAASVYQTSASVQDESNEVACFAVDRNQQSEITGIHEMDNDVRKPVEENIQSHEAFHHVSSHWENEGQPESQLISVFESISQDTQSLDHKHLPCWDTEGQTSEKRVGENITDDLTKPNKEAAYQPPSEEISDRPFGELDHSLLSHDFDTYPLYSIKEESSDIDEDIAELMDYEMVSRDDVFDEETSSEVTHEELLFDDRKSLDRISDSYEFVNEREANTYAEAEEFELMGLDKLPSKVTEPEVLQKELDHELLDSYCYECKCPISAEDRLSGEHKEHNVTNLDTAVTELKGQLDGFLDVLQERSLKVEGFVSEIEALFNSLEENCKEKEQLLEEQNESIIKTVIGHHDRKAQSFEEVKNTKIEYLYEQMVNFQEYIDTAKDTLETIIKETEEMDDFVFLSSSEEINKRLLSAVENILALEKMPTAFSQFEHFAGGSANGNQTLKHMPVPQTPKLQPQDPNSATSTSIAVYWTVNEDDVIDFFQLYCMEKYPGNREQSGLAEEYRVTVKETNCILEELEPGHCYSVWVMAVNYTGCSFPSDKSTFRTAPPTPVIKAEECSVCWNAATIRWSTINPEATDSFTLEYCRQYSPEGEGLRSLAGTKRPEMKVHLESNINYFFYVRAVNIFGTSEQSEAALISTKGTRFHIMKEAAPPELQVSPNGTMICLPEKSEVTSFSPVLGELLSAHGWHYWETTVSGCSAYKVGICYSTVPQDSILGENNTSWCLHCPSKTSFIYKVLHNGEISEVIVTEQPTRIGILLDYTAGRLLFFNAERGQVLFAIRQKFTNAAHPAFVLEQPGVLNLHTGMELPEFVKQS
ncbi:cardiomyopathy-associated protein 5 isoform X2 [Rhineura floridana]|uniref:cardiomyopathy-associated protein 5 isoform X2 n=1 Tax=Rhineura floridana TaxID=261503 RepID=UPI002AC823C1|nr:cardiomyopathy-associated protein 5 isoform X2 [Rhineura floridana]